MSRVFDDTLGGGQYISTPSSAVYNNLTTETIAFWAYVTDYGTSPVNTTETYTIQQFESRKAGAPKDSRSAGAPLASGTYPQNSRTPGTFGPGE